MKKPRYAVVDVETTGFGRADRIVEIGVVILNPTSGEVEDEFDTLINPCRDLGATHIHGVTARMVAAAPTFDEVSGILGRLLDGSVLVAHNLPFDQRFVTQEFDRAGFEIDPGSGLCTLRLSGEKLSQACDRRGIVIGHQHRALSDARATAELFWTLDPDRRVAPVRLLTDLAPQLPRTLRRDAVTGSSMPINHPAPRMRFPTSDESSMSYLNVLDSYLDDLVLTRRERASLAELATIYGINPEGQRRLHTAYVEAMIAAANRDGVITTDEHEWISKIAIAVAVDISIVPEVTVSPSLGGLAGARVCFTGAAMVGGRAMDRMELESLAAQHGLQPVAGVTKKGCDLLVAADDTSMSGKAKKARDYGIPVVSVVKFLALLK
jgi:DNA polymerase-3 subunit epsilon